MTTADAARANVADADPVARVAPAPVLLTYLLVVAAALALPILASPLFGAIANAVLLLVLLEHRRYLVERQRPAGATMATALGALALVPLLTLLSFALAPGGTSAGAYALIGAPAIVAVVLAAGTLQPGRSLRDWVGTRFSRQAIVAASGIPLGLAGYALLEPGPLAGPPSGAALIGAAVVVFTVAGVVEEAIFRGLLQPALGDVLGPVAGTAGASLLFAAAYLGSGSAEAAAFFALVGVLAGAWVQRTGDLAGVAASHGLLAAGLIVVWPVLL